MNTSSENNPVELIDPRTGRLIARQFDERFPPAYVGLPQFSAAVDEKYDYLALKNVFDPVTMSLQTDLEDLELRFKLERRESRRQLSSRICLKDEPLLEGEVRV